MLVIGALTWGFVSRISDTDAPQLPEIGEFNGQKAPGLLPARTPAESTVAPPLPVEHAHVVEFVAVAGDSSTGVSGVAIVVSGPVPQPWKVVERADSRCVFVPGSVLSLPEPLRRAA